MLKSLFQVLDAHPDFYWLPAVASVFALIAWALAERGSSGPAGIPRPALALRTALVLLASLLAWRWPYLLSAVEYNPDESQFIAGAIALARDPVFWRAVDGTTSGPLNFYVLLPLHWAGLPLDYFSARLTALLLIWVALVFCYAGLRTRYDRTVSRLAMLPLAAFFSLVHEWDFIHYSSEHVSLALLAGSIFLFARSRAFMPSRIGPMCAGGFVAGLLPWAKLQAAPLALLLFAWGCWLARRSGPTGAVPYKRNLALLASATAAPTLAALLMIAGTGQGDPFLHGYILQNFYYVEASNSLLGSLRGLANASSETLLLPVLLLTEGGLIACAFAGQWRQRIRPDSFFLLGAGLTAATFAAVVAPRRGFLHYTLFLVIPVAWWGGAALAQLWQRRRAVHSRRALAAVLILVAVGLPIGLRLHQGQPDMVGKFSDHWRHPRSAAGNLLHRLARPGDQLTVWGWLPRLYVESALPQATRIGYSYLSIVPSPLIDYHRAEFMRDLENNRPTFFVDAVGPESYYFLDRATTAHETFPALRTYIREHYVLLADLGYARTYYRRDRFDPKRLPLAELPAVIAQGRSIGDIETLPLQDLAHTNLPEKSVQGHNVRMMLPPATASWLLDGSESEFIFEYGYDPVAWQAGLGNGTIVSVVLEAPGADPQVLFRQLVNPAHVLADRGPKVAKVTLPSIPGGARITIQTAPGPFNDDSWDWAYISRVRCRREILYTIHPAPDQAGPRHATTGGFDAGRAEFLRPE